MTIPGVQSSEAESVGWRCLLARRVLTLIQVYPWCWCSPLSSLPSCPSQSFWSSAGNYNCSSTQTTHLQENYSREMSPKCSSFNLLLVFANFGFTMLGGFVWSLCAPHCCLWSYLQLCLCHRCYIDMLPFLSWDTFHLLWLEFGSLFFHGTESELYNSYGWVTLISIQLVEYNYSTFTAPVIDSLHKCPQFSMFPHVHILW